MTTVRVTPSTLHVSFTRGEKLMGLLRDFETPLSTVTAVDVLPDGLAAARGIRAPGLALPNVRKLGTWRGGPGKTLVAVRRNQPALQVRLAGARYDRLLVGVDDAHRVADELTGALD